jgi:predicted ribosome quality control (RQC) complex YloA/Tae2 family protein
MEIELDLRKTIDENASIYFNKAKKDKKKIEGVKKAIAIYEKKLSKIDKEEVKIDTGIKKQVKREWYEKFRWFISSEGFLVIGGRDATTNEIVIKKYAEKNDLVFHTDMAGSPFVVIKRGEHKGDFPTKTVEEAATFTLVFSKAWKQGLSTASVFSVNPDQVSKKALQGEFLAKGSFMIYGDTTYHKVEVNHAVGIYQGKVMGGPLDAVKKNCKDFAQVIQGNEKTSDVAKKLRKILNGDLDEIIRALPTGCKIKR